MMSMMKLVYWPASSMVDWKDMMSRMIAPARSTSGAAELLADGLEDAEPMTDGEALGERLGMTAEGDALRNGLTLENRDELAGGGETDGLMLRDGLGDALTAALDGLRLDRSDGEGEAKMLDKEEDGRTLGETDGETPDEMDSEDEGLAEDGEETDCGT